MRFGHLFAMRNHMQRCATNRVPEWELIFVWIGQRLGSHNGLRRNTSDSYVAFSNNGSVELNVYTGLYLVSPTSQISKTSQMIFLDFGRTRADHEITAFFFFVSSLLCICVKFETSDLRHYNIWRLRWVFISVSFGHAWFSITKNGTRIWITSVYHWLAVAQNQCYTRFTFCQTWTRIQLVSGCNCSNV